MRVLYLTIVTSSFIVFQMRGVWTPAWASENSETSETWAFHPVKHPVVPKVSSTCRTPIDAFIFRKLEQAGLAPAPPAARLQLIRRVTFDLLGLPPAPEEIDRVSPGPLRRGVCQSGRSAAGFPAYGERWGRHWLDVVRYADTSGTERL